MAKEYTKEQKEKDTKIVTYIEKRNIDINNPYAHIEEKIYFLTEGMQYKNLRVGSNGSGCTWLPVADCKNARISSTVRDTYLAAKKRLTIKTVVNKLEKKLEEGHQFDLFKDHSEH